MSKITYTNKEYIYENASIPEINKITDGNMNEIKSVVNENDTRLTTAEGEIDTAQTDINNAEAVIGNETDTYSASSTYALGSLVIYNSLLYKCTTAITVAEVWTIAHWTQVNLTSLTQPGEILYNNETGSQGAITLSNSSANYEYIEIFFKSPSNTYDSCRVYNPNGKTVCVQASATNNTSPGSMVLWTRYLEINGTSMTTGSTRYSRTVIANSGISYNSSSISTDSLFITRVIGYKEV